MLLKTEEEWCDEDGNDLYPDIVTVDWKRFTEETLEEIAAALDPLGIDVIDYETGGDFWAFRFLKKEEEKEDLSTLTTSELCMVLVGKTEQEAVNLISHLGRVYRIVSKDERNFTTTMDYKPNRINLHVKNGIIVDAITG